MRGQFFLLKNPRILAIALLGFSSGLPLALTNSTLQAWFTQAGISLIKIGGLSLVGMPYIWKFLWSPIIDRFVPPFWGRRRGWIGLMQLALCITLFILANLDPHTQAGTMGTLALLIAFLSASQDIAIDAYRTDTLQPQERGLGLAWCIFATRLAIVLSSGMALVFADYVGWRLTYEVLAGLMGALLIITYFSPELATSVQPPRSFAAAILEPFKDLFQREAIGFILLFIVLYKIGDALAVQLMSAFLLRGLGFSLTDVGLAYKTIGLIASILGALAGGSLLMRIGLFQALISFGIAQACSNLLFMLLAVLGKNYLLMIFSMFIENFCAGMSTTALLVFLTALCKQKYSATQFACLSALTAIGRVFLGPVAALMVEHLGWANFYAWTFIICFPAIILLALMRNKVVFNAEQVV